MRFLTWHMALTAWFLISAFLLGYSPGAAAFTGLMGVLIGTCAFAAAGLPPVRFGNSALAVILALAALLDGDSSGLARANSAILAAVVFALSAIPGRAWGKTAQPEL